MLEKENMNRASIDHLTAVELSALGEVGVCVNGKERSGTYVLRDDVPVCSQAGAEGLELLPIAVALERYDWLREKYYWSAVPADLDEVTARCASRERPQGFFIHVGEGVKIALPLQAGICMAGAGMNQMVHNVVILDPDSELSLITGCVAAPGVTGGFHYAVGEQYVGKGARLTATMVHSWNPGMEVRPRSGTVVGDDGTFVSRYISLKPAGDIRMNPKTWLNGRNASGKHETVILGSDDATIETGGDVYLNGEDSSAEIAHRAVCTGGRMVQEGLLIGNARCRAHVDCAGMMLDPGRGGFILSVPGLKAVHPLARMSHEASVGKISPEQVEYLMSRGMEEREAVSMIIRGFLDTDIEGLGPELDERIATIAALAGHGEE
jgi:Fe-S cluster assembly scaffold protein SufB